MRLKKELPRKNCHVKIFKSFVTIFFFVENFDHEGATTRAQIFFEIFRTFKDFFFPETFVPVKWACVPWCYLVRRTAGSEDSYDQLRFCATSPFALAPTFLGHSQYFLPKMATIDKNPAVLVFALTTTMTYEDSVIQF
jgi:hypothetical protein